MSNAATTIPAPSTRTVVTYKYDLRPAGSIFAMDCEGKYVRIDEVVVEIDGGCIETITYGYFLNKSYEPKGNSTRHPIFVSNAFEEDYSVDARVRHTAARNAG